MKRYCSFSRWIYGDRFGWFCYSNFFGNASHEGVHIYAAGSLMETPVSNLLIQDRGKKRWKQTSGTGHIRINHGLHHSLLWRCGRNKSSNSDTLLIKCSGFPKASLTVKSRSFHVIRTGFVWLWVWHGIAARLFYLSPQSSKCANLSDTIMFPCFIYGIYISDVYWIGSHCSSTWNVLSLTVNYVYNNRTLTKSNWLL